MKSFISDSNKPAIGLILIVVCFLGGLYYYNKPKSYQERLEEEIQLKNNLKSKLTKECQIKIATKVIEDTFGNDVTCDIKKHLITLNLRSSLNYQQMELLRVK